MSLAKTASYPTDFVTETKVGIPIAGKLHLIPSHDGLLLPRTFDDTLEAVGNADDDQATTLSGGIYFCSHWRNGAYIGGLYGLSGGVADAYYRIDREQKQIVFGGSTPRSEFVLEYMSNGVKESGGAIVPREAIPALRSYLIWQDAENDPRVAYNEKERKKRIHEEEVEAMRSFQNAFTADEYLQLVRRNTHQSIKR
jgi:hypothetical protein